MSQCSSEQGVADSTTATANRRQRVHLALGSCGSEDAVGADSGTRKRTGSQMAAPSALRRSLRGEQRGDTTRIVDCENRAAYTYFGQVGAHLPYPTV